MNNIKSFFEWIEIKKDKNGNKFIDNQKIDDPYNNLDRIIKRLQNKIIDKVCGGVRNLENNFGDNKIIHLLYNDDSKKLASIIDEKKVYGYVNFEKDLGLKNTSDIKSIFEQISNGVGKGEVLLSCLFQDVRMKNRESDNSEERGDCAIINDNGMINDGDSVIAFNFRPDRLRELFSALSNKDYQCFDRTIVNELKVVTMMPVADTVKCKNIFSYDIVDNTL